MRTQIALLLNYISSEERDTWLRVGMAIKESLNEDGFELFNSWSQTWAGYKRKDVVTAWRSFKFSKVRIGTLIYLAKQNGHVNNQMNRKPIFHTSKKTVAKQSHLNNSSQQLEASKEAQRRWSASKNVSYHPYIVDKRIEPHSIRQELSHLVIPVRINQKISSIQTIDYSGEKRFLRGGSVSNGYYSIGHIYNNELIICEGFATGATLFEKLGIPVAVAFAGYNLVNVAKVFKKRYPKLNITIAADNDIHNRKNPGLVYGRKAAQAVCAKLIYPDFSKYDNPHGCSDFNDYVCLGCVL